MNWKAYTNKAINKIKFFWHKLSIKQKILIVAVSFLALSVAAIGLMIKSHANNESLSPQMVQFKKDGTMFIELPEKVSENDEHIAHISGQTAPKAHVQIGYGIFGDTTTADNNGNFTLNYDDNIQENTNIKITASLNGKKISRLVTVLPGPKVQAAIESKNKQISQYQKTAQGIATLAIKDKSFSEAKTMILAVSPSVEVKSQSNNNDIPNVSDSDKVTDFKVNTTDTGVSVVLYLEPNDTEKKVVADKKAQEKKDRDAVEARNNFKNNVEAYEVRFKDYAIEYLIDKNTSTIYETTTDDPSVSQSKFTGDMDSRINFNLDGLEMIAFHHYVGNDAVAIFNDVSHNSNKARKMDPETVKTKYFKDINLPF